MRKAFDGRMIIESAPAPEFFIERVTFVESIGRNCIRAYYCTLRDDAWVVQYTSVTPVQFVNENVCYVRRHVVEMTRPNIVLLEPH